MVIIHVAGFQTIAIFMQTGEPARSVDVAVSISDVVIDSPHKVCMQNNNFTFMCKCQSECLGCTFLLHAWLNRTYSFHCMASSFCCIVERDVSLW